MAFEYWSLVLVGVAFLVAGWSATASKIQDVPSELPWVGLKTGMFSGIRTKIASMGALLDTIESGYREYSKRGLSYILPGFDKPMVIIPAEFAKWLSEQPGSILNGAAMQREMLQTDATLLHPSVCRNAIHETIVRRDLTRQMPNLVPEIEEELNTGVEFCWGNNTDEWTDVVVFDTMMKIVARTSNRVFVGLPLCRNEEYLDNAAAFSQDVAISSILVKMIPAFLRPYLSWTCVLSNRWHRYKCSKFLLPFIKQRMADLEKVRGTKDQPNDFTTWYMNEVRDHPDPFQRTPEMIVLRLMTINFAAIHTSTFTATNILFDLYSCPNADEVIAEIREEVSKAIADNNGVWDKHAVARLIKTDSAIRESLRISTFLSAGMARLVVAPKGVTMSNGLHLAQGTRVGVSTYSIHHDEDMYENAMTYDPFRYSRVRARISSPNSPLLKAHSRNESQSSASSDASSSTGRSKAELAKVLEGKNLSTVTTSDTFLAFGHGRHACPGRFFAALEMKLLVAYIVLNYDVKPIGTRPPNDFMGGSILPPMKATISVRRRKV